MSVPEILPLTHSHNDGTGVYMKRIFWYWVISSVTLIVAAMLLSPHVKILSWVNILWIAPLLGLVNAIVGVIAGIIKLLAFPVNFCTLGLFGFIVSFLLYSLAIYWLMHPPSGSLSNSISVDSLPWAMALAVLMAIVSSILSMFTPKGNER